MKWTGINEFLTDLHGIEVELSDRAQAHCFASAREMRNNAMQNMGDLGIRLITGRSRALYGVALTATGALAGYTAWPDDVEFYPEFLNNGTFRMAARPYHDLAFEMTETFFNDGMDRVFGQSMGASK